VLTPLSARDQTYELVSKWLASYITRPHPELGRRGPVCPFVAQALAVDSVFLAAYRFDSERDLEHVMLAIDEGIERFWGLTQEQDSPDLLALIVVFPDLEREYWQLIDEAHRASKSGVVQKGLMLGQFHPSCDAPAAHNTSFPVNRAPIPLLVIRHMSAHDILFLEHDPVWRDHYKATLARRGVPVEDRARRARSAGDRGACDATGAAQPAEIPPAGSRRSRIAIGAPYVRYACVDELQEMQFPLSDSPLELSFILITQVKELLFRMLYVELDGARTDIRDGDLEPACRALARADRVQRVLLASWDTLTGMSADDFAGFRQHLGEASGRQSFMYRALELIMGNKATVSLDYLRGFGSLHRILEQEVAAPSLYDEVVMHLHRHVRPVSEALRRRDVSRPYVASQDVETAWLQIYREPGRYPAEHLLAEALVEVSFQFSRWRATHLLVVERMIGLKSGTGGTDGVQWLQHINAHRFFPELWSVRTKI
jgi:tryptophan 2,3-dioxygenase